MEGTSSLFISDGIAVYWNRIVDTVRTGITNRKAVRAVYLKDIKAITVDRKRVTCHVAGWVVVHYDFRKRETAREFADTLNSLIGA